MQVLENGLSLREILPAEQQKFSDKDKAWIQQMVFGVLRQLPLLQFWMRQLLEKPLKGKNKVAEFVILLGIYQLAFSRVSTHAAVAETVSACQSLKVQSLKGLVNAVLRNFIRQDLATHTPDNAQIKSGLPNWLYKQVEQHYPEKLGVLVDAMHQQAPIWLRVNQRQITVQDYAKQLSEQQVEFSLSAEHAEAIILPRAGDITQLPGYQQGWFAVQDGAAQMAAALLDAQPNERILDACAAPGGKTCHILERQPNLQECIALDVDQSRLDRIAENLQRLQLNADLLCADAASPDKWWDGRQFDRILLDAPCSATGVIRRHPDIKWLRKAKDIDELVQLQSKIMDAMWPLLKPGGSMLYATCSILPKENHQQISAFLQRHKDASLGATTQHGDPPGRQILPGESQMDGFYYCMLLKSQ
ncbi:16S rRNA (cytosine(967)-C(5))-methyltransferase RsmB [Neptunicella marina]|uniref:16S rRNA (cytosine(967)-C(5))-methyltransferase n=2 Tax=Neptunicella marina TaxID=2125989 RepID=A0A8J6IW58_9ALTE|nr:16S rRNA (cytosine(967)-C(5))-methyltransferase RsmB [Neptunicella marina]